MSETTCDMKIKVPILTWHGCYDGGWQNLIVPEAFAHPAKFAYGLIQRIVEYGFVRGYWKAGGTIGDPFGGVALGGIICGYHGLNWVGVELEERFKVLGNQNLDLHRFNWRGLGYDVDVRLLQGDSRQFAGIVAGLDGCVKKGLTDTQPCGSLPEKGDIAHDTRRMERQAEGAGLTDLGLSKGRDDLALRNSRDEPRPDCGLLSGQAAVDRPLVQKAGDSNPRERQKGSKASPVQGRESEPSVQESGGQGPLLEVRIDNAIGSPPQEWRPLRRRHQELGDSLRVLPQQPEQASVVGQKATVQGIITSPPYADQLQCGEYRDPEKCRLREERYLAAHPELAGVRPKHTEYGSTPGQIGRLPAGNVDGVISSPPYAESIKGDHFERETAEASREARKTAGGSLGQSQRHGGYGASEGNIGNLKEGRVEGVITSPPWESSQEGASVAGPSSGMWKGYETGLRPKQGGKVYASSSEKYGATDGQIGNSTGETYWSAMRSVYEQMYLAMKPGGVAAIVLKDYVKNKARVPLCDDTLKLLVSLGFEPVERVHAMLVKETVENTFFGAVTKTKERKSFFRRLAEKKGSPRIDWEEVLFVRKPVEILLVNERSEQGGLFE